MLVYRQAEQGTGLATTTNVLLSPVKAIVFNLYGCQRSLRERFLSSVRDIVIKPGL